MWTLFSFKHFKTLTQGTFSDLKMFLRTSFTMLICYHLFNERFHELIWRLGDNGRRYQLKLFMMTTHRSKEWSTSNPWVIPTQVHPQGCHTRDFTWSPQGCHTRVFIDLSQNNVTIEQDNISCWFYGVMKPTYFDFYINFTLIIRLTKS